MLSTAEMVPASFAGSSRTNLALERRAVFRVSGRAIRDCRFVVGGCNASRTRAVPFRRKADQVSTA
jgi:hypothetical protein